MNQILSHTIVIIDDNDIVLQQMRSILGREPGRNVVTFRDAREALQHCLSLEPDLVLTDYSMPELDGVEFIKRARGDRPLASTQYMLMTGSNRPELDHMAVEAGAAEIIRLPKLPSAIVDKVEAQLSRLPGHWDSIGDFLPGGTNKRITSSVSTQDLQALRCLERLAAFRDEETGHHTARMAHYAAVIAQACGQSQQFQDLLLLAAPLHDLGKVGISDAVLRKPGSLDEAEWELMKQHPVFGYDILREHDGEVFAVAAEIALHHHERWNGSGYPFGLKERDIPLSARIVAVADVFDALNSKRRYKDAWSLDAVLLHLCREAGSQFDPDIVAAVDRCLPSLIRIKVYFDSLPVDTVVQAASREGNQLFDIAWTRRRPAPVRGSPP
jgi:response regulator RpfG family c-di-GMP phosphodiesterase